MESTDSRCLLRELASPRHELLVSPSLAPLELHIVSLLAMALSAVSRCHGIFLITSACTGIKGNSLQRFSVGDSSSEINPRHSVKHSFSDINNK